MTNVVDLINKLLGKIFLSKPVFFGVDNQKITLLVGPSMKVYGIYSSPDRLIKKFPFKEQNLLTPNELKRWSEDNDFTISFSAESPRLRRELSIAFGDVMVESRNKSTEKELSIVVMEELNKSKLPDTIKDWAKQNPEKFISNIRHVQNLLKK